MPKNSIVSHSLVPKNIFQNNVPCVLLFEKKCYGEECRWGGMEALGREVQNMSKYLTIMNIIIYICIYIHIYVYTYFKYTL